MKVDFPPPMWLRLSVVESANGGIVAVALLERIVRLPFQVLTIIVVTAKGERMKAYSKKVSGAKYKLEADRKEKEYQEWLASLTDEEREQHFAEKEKRAERGRKTLVELLAIRSIVDKYSTKINGGSK